MPIQAKKATTDTPTSGTPSTVFVMVLSMTNGIQYTTEASTEQEVANIINVLTDDSLATNGFVRFGTDTEGFYIRPLHVSGVAVTKYETTSS